VSASIQAIANAANAMPTIIARRSDAETAIVRKLIKRFNKWRSGI
jgi:hypothetical protein